MLGKAKQERPESMPSKTTRIETGHGKLYITVTETQAGQPFEVFCTLGKSGQSVMAKAEVTGRLVSLALRHGVPVADLVRQLKGIAGGRPHPGGTGLILSIPDAVGQYLEKEYGNSE